MKKISIMIMAIVVALASCKKTPEVNLKYVDVERDLVMVGTTTANIQCDYEYIASLKKAYFCYGEGENEDNFTSAEMRVVQNTLYVELTGLRESTTYNYYYEFYNGFNSMRSALKSFKTEASPSGVTLPTVITAAVIEITTNSAKGGGEVTNDGGAEVTERGICWSNSANPTISNSHIAAGTGIGEFAALMDGLDAGTTYHVRAYAINEAGTAYGLDKEFTTLNGGGSGEAPEGAINGLFTINENGDQVYFAQGNLQYQASTNTWRFAEHQWDRLKEENINISPTYDGWIDLFNWGTSGYNHGANCYQPWSTSTEPSDYYAYGIETCNLNDQTGQADWGYNPISNGGNQENLWRTLTYEEWCYILFERETPSGYRFVKARVNDIDGAILLPHHWSESIYVLNNPNQGDAYYGDNTVSAEEWLNILQAAGAVFLPNGANRTGTMITSDENGDYWTSTRKMDGDFAYDICIQAGDVGHSSGNGSLAQSVRLVHNAYSHPFVAHEWVDLGLPSGTLWATCNVGANAPEEYGDYFAWGETQPKDYYDWSTYQHCMGSQNKLTKYCTNASYGYNGFADCLTTLMPEDDAATANWGIDWRMPTEEEWQELLNNTPNSWTTQNGVYGRLFEASNGASLFLPAAGSLWDNELHHAGSRGYYWSSSLDMDNTKKAWSLEFLNGNPLCYIGHISRDSGITVRPVHSSRRN